MRGDAIGAGLGDRHTVFSVEGTNTGRWVRASRPVDALTARTLRDRADFGVTGEAMGRGGHGGNSNCI
jgi:hypothetical protein